MTEPSERLLCLAWGKLMPGATDHTDCPVVVTNPSQVTSEQRTKLGRLPDVCMCDCLECKRSWWKKDRPLRDGSKIVTASGKEIA